MVTTRTITAAELDAMGDGAPFELIQGELFDVSPSSPKPNVVIGNVYAELRQFVRPRKLGYVFVVEAGFQVESGPDSVVAPDVAFVARGRLPEPLPARGFPVVVPDLIVEVNSPSDEPHDIRAKQSLYDRIAVPLVWWIDPQKESASIHTFGQPVRQIDRPGTLDGGAVLPGFTVQLSDLFEEI